MRSDRHTLTRPNRISVLSVRSCASSIINAEYVLNAGSVKNSLNSIPSVMYFSTVLSLVISSKRIEYPTSWPNLVPTSSATRAATDMAATRLGWVQPTFMPFLV